jgi:hypothetical protein
MMGNFTKLDLVVVDNQQMLEEKLSYDGPFAFAIIDVDSKNVEPKNLVEKISNFIGDRPFVFIGSQGNLNARVDEAVYQKNPASDLLVKPIVPMRFRDVIEKAHLWAKELDFDESLIEVNREDYLNIKAKSFYLYDVFPHDVYMEVTSDKFIKVFRKNKPYTQAEVTKYIKRGIKFFYLKKEDQLKFLEDTSAMLLSTKHDPSRTVDSICYHVECFAILQQYIRSFGVVETVQKLADHVFTHISQMFDAHNGDFKTILSRFPFRDGGLPEKSVLVSYTCCAILKAMGWGSDSSLRKMLLVSLLHDVSLPDDDLIIIQNLHEDSFKKLSPELQQAFNEHVHKSAAFAEQFSGYPDCAFIIEQHHESPDGKGFPSGWSAIKLTTLSCIFILAHNISLKLLIMGASQNTLDKVLVVFNHAYNLGNFKDPIKYLGKYLKRSF